jgi:cadherin 7, type 2
VTQLAGLKAQRPQNSDVGEFINSKLREIDNDPIQPPYDSLQEYAYEGEGSMYGSILSSLEVKLDEPNQSKMRTFASKKEKEINGNSNENDSDIECIKNWGPKFNKISNIYGFKSDDI